MSPVARLRLVSIGCGVLTIAIRAAYLVNMIKLHPWGAWFLGSSVASILIPVGLWFVLARRSLRRRPTFGLDAERQRYVAGARPLQQLVGVQMFALASISVVVRRVPHTDHVRLVTENGLAIYLAPMFALLVALGLVLILLDRPRLLLDPDGMTLMRIEGRRQRVAWDDIAIGTAVIVPPQGGVGIRIAWRLVTPARRQFFQLPAMMLAIDTVFLLHAVRVYVDQPDRRSEIGTQAGLDRLQRERSDALAAAAGFVPVG